MLSDQDPDELGQNPELLFEEQRDWSKTQFKVRRRVFKKSLKSYFMLLTRFAGPAFGIVFYLMAVFFWDVSIMSSVQPAKFEVFYAHQRRVLVSRASVTCSS